MKLYLAECSSKIREAVLELEEMLGMTVVNEKEGKELELCLECIPAGNTVIEVRKEAGRAVIRYARLHELFRGLFLLAANWEKEEFYIKQGCLYEDFGILLDCSRNAVLNRETAKDMIRHIALMGYTALQLYTEDTFLVPEEEYFGYMRGAFTKTEIKEMDEYCGLFGIELVPCIQCLAHINQITRYEQYDRIVDTDDILLVGAERTYTFLDHIFHAIADNFTSRKINIGMDEAHMLGLGKYLDQNGYQPRFDLMLEHLDKVRLLCKKYGFEPQMWSDMFFRLVYGGEYYAEKGTDPAEAFDKIPKDIRLIYWDYYSTDYDRYDSMIKKHQNISQQIGFAGGAWKWTGFAPHNAFSLESLKPAMKACKNNQIKNFVLTCWGDNGAEASIYSILPSIYACAEMAYCGGNEKEESEFETGKFRKLTGISLEEFKQADLPNHLTGGAAERNNASKFFLYNDLLMGTFDSLVFEGISDIYEKHAESLEFLIKQRAFPNGLFEKYKDTFRTLQKLCEVLRIKAELGLKLKEAYDKKDKMRLKEISQQVLPELKNKQVQFYQAVKNQWHKENKSFGFEVQCARLGGLMQRTDYVKERLEDYLSGNILRIEELEQERKPFAYFDEPDLGKLNYNLWNVIISPGIV